MKSRWWLLSIVILAIAGAAYFWMQPKTVTVDVLTVKREDVQTSVVASGRVLAPARVELGATITGRVTKVLVREGERITEGQLLVQLEQAELVAAVNQARAARERARARIDSVAKLALPMAREAQTQAEWNVATAERELKRSQELLAKGFISQSRVDEAERLLEVAKSQLASAKSQVSAQSVQGGEAQQAREQFVEAEAALALAQAKLTQTEIRAPAAGVVLERTVEAGDITQPAQSARRMMTLALDGPARLIVQVDEKNLPLLERGRSALAAADAFATERFESVIAYISPGVDAARGTVELRLDIPKPPAFLKSDMTVAVDIPGPLLRQAVFVPADMVRQLQSDAPYVVVERDGVATRAPVQVGTPMQGKVQIVKGLQAGERLVLTRDVELGSRVRARQ